MIKIAVSEKMRKIILPLRFLTKNFIPISLIRFMQNKTTYNSRKRFLGISESKTPMFDSVYFEVRTRCNGTCPFCAASIQNETREDKTMPMELYKKVINELRELRFSGRIAYHINSDPLIFPQLAEFVSYARKELPSAWIQILTNGKALTYEKAEEIIKAGINEISINHYNDDFSAEIPEVFRRIRYELLPKFFRPEHIKEGHYEYHIKQDMNVFKFNVFRRRANAILSTRAGTSPNKKKKTRMPRGFCELPFTQLNITTDGRVSKCGSDHYFSDVMGNVKEQSIMEIWTGERFRNIRRKLLKNKRDTIKTCSKCDFYGCEDPNMRSFPILGKLLYVLTK